MVSRIGMVVAMPEGGMRPACMACRICRPVGPEAVWVAGWLASVNIIDLKMCARKACRAGPHAVGRMTAQPYFAGAKRGRF